MASNNRDVLLDPTGQALESLPKTRLSSLLADAPGAAEAVVTGPVEEWAEVHSVFRNIARIMERALQEHDNALFSEGIASFVAIWRLGDPAAMYPVTTPDREASLWEGITVELYTLGALAVVHERWAELRELATTQPDESARLERTWLRQGQVASSRATKYPEETVLRLAIARLLASGQDEGSAHKAATRFDLLAGLITSEEDAGGYFPNAAEFSESLVEPLVTDHLRDSNAPVRQYVFAGDDDGLRESLRDYDHTARSQAAMARRIGRDWQWRAFYDARTWAFINEGQMIEAWEIPGGAGWV